MNPGRYTDRMKHLALAFDESLARHDTGPGHPERPQRLAAVRAGLESADAFSFARRIEAEPISLELAARLHDEAYIARLREACRRGQRYIDSADSVICSESFELARRAAGMAIDTARAVARGAARRGFAAVRPPGHHAERDRSMGFCLFNNVALAAVALREEFGLERIAIVDWDVHHGNGTQHLFEEDADVLFVSLHEHPDHQYPGTGYAEERGRGAGTGFTRNVPLLPGVADQEYLERFEREVVPLIDDYAPRAILISAGFDAHHDDPLGHLKLSENAFVIMTRRLIDLAEGHAAGRLVSVLEGGYDLPTLRNCVSAHVQELLA